MWCKPTLREAIALPGAGHPPPADGSSSPVGLRLELLHETREMGLRARVTASRHHLPFRREVFGDGVKRESEARIEVGRGPHAHRS